MWCKFPLTTPGDGSIVAVRSAEVRPTREHPATRSNGLLSHHDQSLLQGGSRLPHRLIAAPRRAVLRHAPDHAGDGAACADARGLVTRVEIHTDMAVRRPWGGFVPA